MHKFQEYYMKLISESPVRLGHHYGDYLDYDPVNQVDAPEYLDDTELIKEPYSINGLDFKIVDNSDSKIHHDYFIDKQPLIRAYFLYQVDENNNMIMEGVWNHKTASGLARLLFFQYYLPQYHSITSDSKQTTQGEKFWLKLIKTAKVQNKRVTVLTGKGEYDVDDAQKYWGNAEEFFNYRLRIYR